MKFFFYQLKIMDERLKYYLGQYYNKNIKVEKNKINKNKWLIVGDKKNRNRNN